MKLSINKISTLNASIAKLGELKLPIKTAWAIHKISSELADKLRFLGEEERKVIEKYNGTILPNGNIQFANEEDSQNAFAELNTLHLEELECEFEPIEIAFDDIEDCKIEPNILTGLNKVVTFK